MPAALFAAFGSVVSPAVVLPPRLALTRRNAAHMKQLLLLSTMTILGGFAGLHQPFWGVLLYYTLAVLRPQYLWEWALPIEIRWSLAAAVIVLIGFGLNFNRFFNRCSINLITTLMIGHGLLIFLSVITAFDPVVAQSWATDYAKVLLIAVIAGLVIEHFWQIRLAAAMILLMLGYIAWEVNFQYFFQNHRLDILHYGYAGLDNNGAGLLMAMAIPFAYCFALRGVGRWNIWTRIAAVVLGMLLVHSLLLTYSRGAMLSAVIGVAWLLLHHRPRWQIGGMAGLIIVGVLLLAGPEIRREFMSTKDYQQDKSAHSRLDSWAAAWDMAWDYPLLGTGVRNSNHFSQNYGADHQNRTIHNQYLQIAADSGVPAAILYVAMLGAALYNLTRARRACLAHLQQSSDADDGSEEDTGELLHAEKLILAVQASILIFVVDGMFLSLETFELPWLLLVLAGVMPVAVQKHLKTLGGEHDDPAPLPRPALLNTAFSTLTSRRPLPPTGASS
jgi:probable O-glycosylation ligase (exosortase A-associated)